MTHSVLEFDSRFGEALMRLLPALLMGGLVGLNRDLRGKPDLFGHPLRVSETALADELAAAASLLMGQADEGHPVVLISGLPPGEDIVPARALIRPASEDLFR